MRAAVKRRQAQLLAEGFVGVVSPQRRPVVVRAIIEILVLVVVQSRKDTDEMPALHHIRNFVDAGFLVHLGRGEGQLFRIDGGGRRHQHEADLAGAALGQRTHRREVLVPRLLLAGQHAVPPGEHPVLLAQQDAAALGLLEQGRLGKALKVDPLIPPEDLILDVFRVIGEVAVQPVHRHRRELGPLGEGGVFHLTVCAVGRCHIQHEEGDEKQAEGHQHRVLFERGQTLFLFHDPRPPQKLKYRNGLLVLPTT